MSDVNFNINDTLAGSGSGGGGTTSSAPILKEVLTYTPSSNTQVNTGAFIDLPGVVNQSIEIPETGDYLVTLHIMGIFAVAAGAQPLVQLLVDDVIVGSFTTTPIGNINSLREGFSTTAKFTLAAGTRNLRFQWASIGAGVLHATAGVTQFQLVII